MRSGRFLVRPLLSVAATVFFLFLALCGQTAEAQVTTATFYGVLVDSTGARIPGADVTLTHLGTGAVTKKATDATGEFAFDFLAIGAYTLKIEAAGFKAQERTGITLSAGQSVRQTFTMEVGSRSETVTITDSAPLVDTVSTQQLQNFTTQSISELPLSRRNVTEILGLGTGTGVSSTSGTRGVRINGVGKTGTGISVDGTDANAIPDGRGISQYGGENYIDVMSIESVAEVQVVRGILAAEYGGVLGGQVNLISKSGSNNYHGSAFENYQSHVLRARNPFTPNRLANGSMMPKPPVVFNQFGGSFGGPIIRDKVFGFGSYEGYREASSATVSGNVPTESFRADILKALPFPQTKIVLDTIPLPTEIRNQDQGRFVGIKSRSRRENNIVLKGDARLTQASNTSFTYTRSRPFYLTPSMYLNGVNDRTFNYQQDRVSASHITGGTNWTSETRFGGNFTYMTRLDGFFDVLDPAAPEVGPWGRRMPLITLSGTSGFSTPSGELWLLEGPTYSVTEKIARHAGKHSLKFGADYMFSGGSKTNPQTLVYQYANKADLLSNTPARVEPTFGTAPHKSRMFETGLFVQDDWRVTPKLVVNLGVRYDFYHRVSVEGTTSSPVGIYNLSPATDWNKFNFGPFRDPKDPYNDDPWVNLGPRVGFAYSFGNASKTVIRGGTGVLFSPNVAATPRQGAGDPVVPFRVTWSQAEAKALGLKWPISVDELRGVVKSQAAQTGSTFVFSVLNPGLQSPYTMQAMFNIEHSLTPNMMIETGYVGVRGVKFILQRRFNEADRLTGLRPNPSLGAPGGYYVDNTQNSAYHGWQTSLRKRFARNVTFEAHYTFSKALSVTGGDIGAYYQGDAPSFNQEFAYPRADRGPSVGDVRHNFAANWLYEVPTLSRFENRILRGVLSGWQISGILNASSGSASDVTQTCSSGRYCRPDYVGGKLVLDNWKTNIDPLSCNPGIHCGVKYLNTAAFVQVPLSSAGIAIRPGNAGFGIVRGPGSWTTNAALARNFQLTERMRLQFRADMFNSLNHVNYGNPTTSINSSTFGIIRSAGSMRVVQLNGRISF